MMSAGLLTAQYSVEPDCRCSRCVFCDRTIEPIVEVDLQFTGTEPIDDVLQQGDAVILASGTC